MARARALRAFTLIELLVVILIIAAVSSVIVPAYVRFWAGVRFRGQATEIQDLFAYAREQAIQRDAVTTLTFDPQGQVFAVASPPLPPDTGSSANQSNSQNNADSGNMADTQDPGVSRVVQVGNEFRVVGFTAAQNRQQSGGDNSAAPTLHFQGDGTVEGAEFSLISQSGDSMHMVVWPGTGRLTVEDQSQ